MQKIKVLILHNYMTPYRFPLFEAISKDKDIDLTVYFMSRSAKNRKWKTLPKLSFKYKLLPKIEFNYFGNDLFSYIVNYTFPFLLIKEDFDVVISAGWLDFASQVGFFISKIMGKKFIIWSESTVNENSWQRKVTLPFVKFLVQNSDACIAIGTRSKEYFQLLGANPEKIYTAYSTVDIDYFSKISKLAQKERYKFKKSLKIKTKKAILFVGQFIKRKGVLTLIKAFSKFVKKHKNVSLVLLGYGSEKEKYYSYIRKFNLTNVIFLDHVEVDQMPKIYGAADVFVLPSLEETWGLVVNEAMACGLPVVVSKKAGCSVDLVVDGQNGFTFTAGNSVELQNALEKTFHGNNIKKFGKQSSRLIKNFSPKNASEVFIEAIG